jgi:hypothetical protein
MDTKFLIRTHIRENPYSCIRQARIFPWILIIMDTDTCATDTDTCATDTDTDACAMDTDTDMDMELCTVDTNLLIYPSNIHGYQIFF